MPNYSNGKIYTIRNRIDDPKIYVGSTIQALYSRFSSHKLNCKTSKYCGLLYKEIDDNNWNDWYIEFYENYSSNNRKELNKERVKSYD